MSVNSTNLDKRTPLHLASSFVRFHFCLNLESSVSSSPFLSFFLTSIQGHFEVVKYLIQKGAQVHILDRYDNTPKSDAERFNHTALASLLHAASIHPGQSPPSAAKTHLPARPASADKTVIPPRTPYERPGSPNVSTSPPSTSSPILARPQPPGATKPISTAKPPAPGRVMVTAASNRNLPTMPAQQGQRPRGRSRSFNGETPSSPVSNGPSEVALPSPSSQPNAESAALPAGLDPQRRFHGSRGRPEVPKAEVISLLSFLLLVPLFLPFFLSSFLLFFFSFSPLSFLIPSSFSL